MLTGAQFGLYNRLWRDVLAVKPDADREAMHADLCLPESRKDWANDDLDEWKRACLAISDPGNLNAQIEGLPGAGEAKRKRFVIDGCLAKLGKSREYAEGIARRAGYPPDLKSLGVQQLEGVLKALRREIRERTPKPGYRVKVERPDWSVE
jgi:hypothetical protein